MEASQPKYGMDKLIWLIINLLNKHLNGSWFQKNGSWNTCHGNGWNIFITVT